MSPRSNEDNERVRARTREKILAAGLKVFAVSGYHAATIAQVAREAGLSHGLVYHYFESKEDILLELTARAYEGSIEAVRRAAAAPGGAWKKIERVTAMLYENAVSTVESSYYFYLMLQASLIAATMPKLSRLMARRMPEYNNILVPLIKKGQKDGTVVKGDPEKLAMSFWSLVQGLSLSGLQYKGGEGITDPSIMLNLLRKRSQT
jgi:AcrR family transcriptional regulator